MRVLIVDHADSVRSRLVSRLREAGLDVVGEAATVEVALVMATSLGPDAVVADVLFPDRRGPDVVRALRAAAPAATLVILSNAVHYRASCLAHGADHFLDKSAQFDEVTATVRRGRR